MLTALIPQATVVLPNFTMDDPSAVDIDPREQLIITISDKRKNSLHMIISTSEKSVLE